MDNTKSQSEKPQSERIVAKYTGDGSWIPGVPAKDLTLEEVIKAGLSLLISSGLYREIGEEE